MLAMRASMVGNVPPVVQASFLTMTAETTPSWIDNSGTVGNRMVTDSTGTLTWAPSNMLLNSATLSTQTVTVTSGATNILSFTGTGSITYSGAASGTLSGTGASNRVSVVLTMTTASLTLTVSGSVTQAQLERVTYQTQPRPWIATTGSAVFMPRYDFDASTTPAMSLGMRIEETRTNLLGASQSFDGAAWTKTRLNTTGTPAWVNVETAPDGTMTADKLIEDTNGSSHFANQAVTVSSGATYTYSIYAKAAERGFLTIYCVNTSAALNTFFNLRAGSIVSTSSGATATITPVGNGWYRCSVTTATTAATSGIYPGISTDGINATYTGDGVSGLFVWGAQVEAGAFASSYIPNLAATGTATRLADVVKLTGTALTTLQGVNGTAVVEVSGINSGTGNFGQVLSVNGTTALIAQNGSSATSIYTQNAAATVISATLGSGTLSSVFRGACSYSAAAMSVVGNNGTVGTGAGPAATVSTASLGSRNNAYYINNCVRSVALYNQRLPDATLRQKSTVGAAY